MRRQQTHGTGWLPRRAGCARSIARQAMGALLTTPWRHIPSPLHSALKVWNLNRCTAVVAAFNTQVCTAHARVAAPSHAWGRAFAAAAAVVQGARQRLQAGLAIDQH